MSFPSEVRQVLRSAGVPVSTPRHPYGAVVKATSGGEVWITVRPRVSHLAAELAREVSYVARSWGWRCTHVTGDTDLIIVHQGGRAATLYTTPLPARGGGLTQEAN